MLGKSINQIKHSFKLISRNKTRSVLTVLGIILATLIYTFGVIYVNHIKEKEYIYYQGFPEDSMLVNKCSIHNSKNIQNEFSNSKSNLYLVDSIQYNNFQNSKISINLNIIGVEKSYLDYPLRSHDTKDSLETTNLIAGRKFDKDDFIIGDYVVHLHQSYAKLLFNDENYLGKILIINDLPYKIVGILKDTPDVKRIYNKYTNNLNEDLEMTFYIPSITYKNNGFNLKYENHHLIFRFDNCIPYELSNDNQFTKNKVIAGLITKQKGMLILFDVILYGILIFTGILIFIIMMFNIKERIFEIGFKMAVGASKDDIRFHFLSEGLIYCLLGSIMGIAIGCSLGLFYMFFDFNNTGRLLYIINFNTIIKPFVASLVIVIFSSLIPAIYASRINIVACLKVD